MLVTSLAILLFGAGVVRAQWTMQESHTTADLRGIHNVGGGVAWASGTNGTVLRTLDGGATWAACAVPPDAEKLDFRGVQAFDASTAIVMSSGKGDLSRLYKTTDGCATWKVVFTNPDSDGFFDSIYFPREQRQRGEREGCLAIRWMANSRCLKPETPDIRGTSSTMTYSKYKGLGCRPLLRATDASQDLVERPST